MRTLGTLAAAALLLGSGAALATPSDAELLLYGGAGQGRVVFDGRLHASKGMVCNDCHLGLFATRKLALITLEDHQSGKACFACHDGARAFSDCASCHRK